MPARYARSIAAADALISISRFTYDGILQLCPTARNIVSIPNGVHLEPFQHQAARPEQLDRRIQRGEYFLFIGRLHERKGVDVLLDAMALLPARRRGLLVVAGDGDERAPLEVQCARLKLQNHVRFVGSAKGTTKTWLLQNARFVVTPSRTWEAFGLVVLESYAAGRGVITSMLPGMMDLVVPGETGLLVPPESPTELAQAVGTMWEDETLAQRCGERARRVAQNFSWRTIAERHLDLYMQVAGVPALRLAA